MAARQNRKSPEPNLLQIFSLYQVVPEVKQPQEKELVTLETGSHTEFQKTPV